MMFLSGHTEAETFAVLYKFPAGWQGAAADWKGGADAGRGQ